MPPIPFNKAVVPVHPKSLTLTFSRAADYGSIDRLFDPSIKRNIDPHHYVVQRLDPHFRAAINNGAVAMLVMHGVSVMAMTAAYRVNHTDKPPHKDWRKPHDVTEMGTSLARLQGYNSARLVIAALTLREWWTAAPRDVLVAEIKKSNGASVKTYVDGLGWEPLLDLAHMKRLHDATDVTLADDKDKESSKHLQDIADAQALLHVANDNTIRKSAQAILDFMAQGGLVNKATGDKIAVDFTALEREGLTKARLSAIAQGTLDRAQLRAIGHPPPRPAGP